MTRATSSCSSSSVPVSVKTTDSSLCSFFTYSRMYRNHFLGQIWASMSKKSASNQRNSSDPLEIKFKLYAVFVKWGSWINFLFMRGQDIVNKWDFPSKIFRHCLKRLVSKIVNWHDQREIFVKMSLRDRLDCLVEFVGTILLCLLRLRNCFFRVCFPTPFAAVLKDFLPLITSPISGAANSNMSATMSFAAGTTYLRKNGISVLPITCARAPNPLPLSSNPSIVWNFYLSWSNHLVVPHVLELNVEHLSKHQHKASDSDRYKGYLFTWCVSQINVYTMKRIFEQRSKL